jgi:selenide,water dikinase
MTRLNDIGMVLGELPYVTAMTDVTGFGLLGHLLEVCEGSDLSAEIEYSKIPMLSNIAHYASKMIYPDNTMRNWQSYDKKVSGIGSESLLTLCDPQTSGGLLVCVDPDYAHEFYKRMDERGMPLEPFGRLTEKQPHRIIIKV